MLLDEIKQRWSDIGEPHDKPLLRSMGRDVSLDDISQASGSSPVDSVPPGSTVALIGDFTPLDIVTLLKLIDAGCIVVPLTDTTSELHAQFFDVAGVEWVIQRGDLTCPCESPTNRSDQAGCVRGDQLDTYDTVFPSPCAGE
jgi:hypothetical protein